MAAIIESQKNDSFTEIFEVNKKDWKLEKRAASNKHYFDRGAIASSSIEGKLYITGSASGRTKIAASI